MTQGAVGYFPDWYELIEAARWLHVAPWELAKQPRYWTDVALAHKRVVGPLERKL